MVHSDFVKISFLSQGAANLYHEPPPTTSTRSFHFRNVFAARVTVRVRVHANFDFGKSRGRLRGVKEACAVIRRDGLEKSRDRRSRELREGGREEEVPTTVLGG